MSPRNLTPSLLTPELLADIRDRMTAAELLQRAAKAAALELSGKQYREARADIAAQIVAAVLERTAGTLPHRADAQVSLTALCDRAKTLRRSLDRQRAHDRQHADAEADLAAQSVAGFGMDEQADAEADRLANIPTPRETLAAAVSASARLGCGTDAATVSLVYRSARESHGLTGAAIAAELRSLAPGSGLPCASAKALDTRCSRARKALAVSYDADAARFLARLTRRTPRQRWHWQSVPIMRSTRQRTSWPTLQRVAPVSGEDSHGPYATALDFAAGNLSRAAGGRWSTPSGKLQRDRAADWRTRPDADAPISLRSTRKRTPKLATVPADERTAARARLADAEAGRPTRQRSAPTLPPKLEHMPAARERTRRDLAALAAPTPKRAPVSKRQLAAWERERAKRAARVAQRIAPTPLTLQHLHPDAQR